MIERRFRLLPRNTRQKGIVTSSACWRAGWWDITFSSDKILCVNLLCVIFAEKAFATSAKEFYGKVVGVFVHSEVKQVCAPVLCLTLALLSFTFFSLRKCSADAYSVQVYRFTESARGAHRCTEACGVHEEVA